MRQGTGREGDEAIIVGMPGSTCHWSEVFGIVNWKMSTVDLVQERESCICSPLFYLVHDSVQPGQTSHH